MLIEMRALMPDGAESLVPIVVESLVAQVLGYFAVVGLVFMVVWWWGRERFRAARIPAPAKFDRAQLRRELWNTLGTFVAGTGSVAIVMALQVSGHTSLTTGAVPAVEVLAWTTGFVLFNDAWFYGWHRLLHHPRLFRHVHAVHHKSVDVNPFTSYSFHMLEALILGAWIVPVAIFLPLPMAALGLLQASASPTT
jgi:sterol desaturase/sphingolipid hydroxylase (fatty acid hydroxylase superfamily)